MTNTQILNKLKALQKAKDSKTKFWNITWLQGVFLSNLIEIKQPKQILEIGTSNGFSTLWMALNLSPTNKITTIEINTQRFEISQNTFKSLNLTNITSLQADIIEILPTLKNKYDFIFMDAKQEFYLNVIKKIERLSILTPDFTIVVDNVASHGNMSEFTSYMHQNYNCETIEIGGGFLIAKSKK